MPNLPLPPLNYRPHIQPHRELGIGIIGSGGILRHGHLPAYRNAGYSVVAIAGRNAEAVQELGTQWEIEHRYQDWRALLENPAVDIVDVAIPGEGRVELVRAAAAAGKHLMVQKPLADTLDEAREIVNIAREAGVLLAVNQNARWAPAYRAAWSLLQQNFLGEVFDITHELRSSQDSAPFYRDSWNARAERYQIVLYAVHHLDLMRFWMGREPQSVTATTSRKPGQVFRGEMMADISLDFGPTAHGLCIERNACWAERKPTATFRIEGTEGMIEGDAMTNSLTVWHRSFGDESWQPELTGSWFPDSFGATMGELMDAIAGEASLVLNGEDNLKTLALVEAAYLSIENRRAVEPSAITNNKIGVLS